MLKMIATNKQIAAFSPRIPISLHNTLGYYNDTAYIREKQLSTIIEKSFKQWYSNSFGATFVSLLFSRFVVSKSLRPVLRCTRHRENTR